MAADTTTAVYSCNLILSPKELDFHMLSSLLKTVAAFARRVQYLLLLEMTANFNETAYINISTET